MTWLALDEVLGPVSGPEDLLFGLAVLVLVLVITR